MQPVKISAISYLNTIPFVYGLEQCFKNNEIELTLEVPSLSAQKLISKQANIALVPVAVLPLLPGNKKILNYCIGANGIVKTVLLVSSKPLQEITSIHLDSDSRTSVELVKILAKHYWKIDVQWLPLSLDKLPESEAAVIIGDKTFHHSDQFVYKYDLAVEWKRFTGLPFVFACWVSVTDLPADFLASFNHALEFGITHIEDAVTNNPLSVTKEDAIHYLTENISFRMDDSKKQAIELFHRYLRTG